MCIHADPGAPTPGYFWTITSDRVADLLAECEEFDPRCSRAGMVGPDGCTLSPDEIRSHPSGVRFRVLDEYDHVFYEGVLVGRARLDQAFFDDFGHLGWFSFIDFDEGGTWTRQPFGDRPYSDWTPFGMRP